MQLPGAGSPREPAGDSRRGRLAVRPLTGGPAPAGLLPGIHRHRANGLLYVPPAGTPPRLVVTLHGAGGTADQALDLLIPDADRAGLVLLAPQAQGSTWDLLGQGFGADVDALEASLREVFAAVPVVSGAVSVAGFSDGASYALSLGLANGDLFDSVLAFSPGFAAPMLRNGCPRVFVSHGTGDPVLPVQFCGRRVAAMLQAGGYPLDYREFDGGHEVPPAIRSAAVRWLLNGTG